MPKRKPKRRAKHYVVRIVVVQTGVTGAQASGGLTKRQLEAAEAHLKGKPPPPAKPGVKPTGAVEPANLFDAVKSTDIIVVDGQPASVRTESNVRHVFSHNHEHRDAVLRVWTESDTIDWRCDFPFSIEQFEKVGWKQQRAPSQPFQTDPHGKEAVDTQEPPARSAVAVRNAASAPHLPRFSYRSSTLKRTANNQQYKVTFIINGQRVDPDIMCGDPPPNP